MQTFDTTLDGTPIKAVVRKPTVADRERARLVEAKAFRDAVLAGAFRLKQLEAVAERDGPDEGRERLAAEVRERLAANARKVPDAAGRVLERGVTREEAKRAAVQMRVDRLLLHSLSAERVEAQRQTAEALAENAAFDFLVSVCTRTESGDPVFRDVEDYKERANRDEDVANRAAALFAFVDRGIPVDWEGSLPEVKYLRSVGFFGDGGAEPEPETFPLEDGAGGETGESPAAPAEGDLPAGSPETATEPPA